MTSSLYTNLTPITLSEYESGEFYAPGLIYHLKIIKQSQDTIHAILSLPHPGDAYWESLSIDHHSMTFGEYLQKGGYPVWKDILGDTDLSPETYTLGKYITLQYPLAGKKSSPLSDILIELGNILSVFHWAKTTDTPLSEETLKNIHNILILLLDNSLEIGAMRDHVSLKSGSSFNLDFFMKNKETIEEVLISAYKQKMKDFSLHITQIVHDIISLEYAIEKGDYTTYT